MPSARKKCICQLCTCGRHMCLHRSKEQHLVLGEDNGLALDDHKIKKQAELRSWTDDGTQNQNTYKEDVDPRISSAVDQINAQQVLANASDRETALTVEDKGNSQEFVNDIGNGWSSNQVPRRQIIRPSDNLRTGGESNFTTVNQLEYTKKSSDFVSQVAEAKHQEFSHDSWSSRQIPKTLPIKKPDSLTLTGPLSLETTNKKDFNETVFQNKAAEAARGETTHRPRTSLKLSGEFQSDTTSLDYRAAVTEQMRWENESRRNAPLKLKRAKPQSGIKIPEVPLQDETTAVTDYRRWSVEKPERHKPADTLQLGDGITDIEDSSSSLARNVYSETEAKLNAERWRVSRPVVRKPQNNLKNEGNFNFATTNDTDYSNRRSRHTQLNLETVTERSEREAADAPEEIAPTTNEFNAVNANITEKETQHLDASIQNKPAASSTEDTKAEASPQPQVVEAEPTYISQPSAVYETQTHEIEPEQRNGDQLEYVTWDQIRPKAIRPHSNLRQEGRMEFDTTNRREFIQRSSERVHGVRPKTTTKLSEADFDATTMNQIMFSHDQVMHGSYPIERVQKIVPQSNLRTSSGTFNSETTNKAQFQEYHIDRPKPIKPVPNLRQEGSMDFTTMNQLQFEEKPMEKVSQFRPQTSTKITGDFDGVTTNNIMYGAQPLQKPQMIKPKGNIELEKGAFARDTTNNLEFQQWQGAKPQAITPRNNLQQEGDFDFTTTNQLQYAGKVGEKVSQIRPKSNPKVTGEFDGTSTNRVMYQNISGERSKAIRPKTNLQMERGNFEGETTNSHEYQTWGYEKASPIKPHSSIRHEGSMDFTTTNNMQFEGKTTERPMQIRPTTSTKIMGDFDGTTTNQVMFQNNPLDTVRGIRPSTHIHLDEGKFEDQTTARREYQKWEIAKTEAIRPSGNLTQEGTMDFTTSNQREFGEKLITRAEQIRPHTTSPVTGKFDGTTTNQVMYQGQIAEKIHDIRPKDNLHVESGEFKGESTTSREYGYKEGGKSESIKPRGNLSQEGDFDFVTSNQLQYEEKAIDRVSQNRPKTHTKLSDGKFYSKTTSQDAFQTPAMETVQTLRPSTNLRVDNSTFQGNTTMTDAYQQWKYERPKAFQLASSLKQEGNMSFETTNTREFKEKSFERVKQIRPKTSSKIEGDFEGTTTNQAMFHQPDKLDRVKPIKHENNLHLEHGRFSDETTTNREYRQWVSTGNQIAVPKKKLLAAGISTQREKPNRRKEIAKTVETDQTTNLKGKEHDPWKVANSQMEESNSKGMINVNEKQSTPISDETGVENVNTSTSNQIPDVPTSQPQVVENHVEELKVESKENTEHAKDISTMQADYGTKQMSKFSNTAAPAGNLTLTGDMNFNTTSQNDFTQKEVAYTSNNRKQIVRIDGPELEDNVTGAAAPAGNLTLTGDMNFNTTSQNDFTQKEVAYTSNNRKQIVRKDGPKLENNVNSKSENYDSWKLAQSEGIYRSQVSKGVTEEMALGRKQQNVKNVKGQRYKPRDNLKLDHVPFDATSTTRTEYKKIEGRRSSSKRRRENLKQEGEMQFDTTSNDYSVLKDHPFNRESRPKIKEELKKGALAQTGSMEFSTTSKSSYVGASTTSRAKNLRPRSSLRLGVSDTSNQEMMSSSRSNPETSTRENDLTSTSRASYVGYVGTRTRANRPSTSQKVGEGAFEGQTTSRSSFTVPQEKVAKSRTIKPENHNILHTDNGFTGDTTYRSSFETKKGHCPVLDIQSGNLSMTFKEERNGHIFYAPRVQG